MFAVRTAYESIAEADERRREYLENEEYQQFVAKLSPMLAKPPSWEVNENLAAVGM